MKHHYASLVLLGMSMLAVLDGWLAPSYPVMVPTVRSADVAEVAMPSCFSSAAVNGMQVRDARMPSDTALRRFARFDDDAATAALHLIVQQSQRQSEALPAGLKQVVLCDASGQDGERREHLAI